MAMKAKTLCLLGGAILSLTGCANLREAHTPPLGLLAFVGTQGDGPGQGIHAVRLDPASGTLTSLGLAAEATRATWLLADQKRGRLFAVNESGNDGITQGQVASYRFDPVSGALTKVNAVDSGGGGPTHLALAPQDDALFTANYGTGQVAGFRIGSDGHLAGPVVVAAHEGSGPTRRQKGPHAHGVTIDPSGHYLISPDLGADKVFVYRLGAAVGTFAPAEIPEVLLPAGSGPRHIVFSPDGRHAFLMTEMAGTIYSFAWDAQRGHLSELTHIALDAENYQGNRSGSEIAVSLDGRFVYAGNRGANSIQVYAVGKDAGLSLVQTIAGGGQNPWSFAIGGSGKWLVVTNQATDNLAVFSIDKSSGRIADTGKRMTVVKPTSIVFTDR